MSSAVVSAPLEQQRNRQQGVVGVDTGLMLKSGVPGWAVVSSVSRERDQAGAGVAICVGNFSNATLFFVGGSLPVMWI